MNQQHARWLGLSELLTDAVEHATTAVERIHMATSRTPFKIIESIPPISAPAHMIHEVHDSIVTNTYSQIRFWNATVRKAVQAALSDGDAPSDITRATLEASPWKKDS